MDGWRAGALSSVALCLLWVNPAVPQVVHPVPDRRVAPDVVTHRVSRGSVQADAAPELADLLRYAPVGVVGRDERDPEAVIGRLSDVALRGGRLFIVDAFGGSVTMFALDGERLASLGRRGQGPGELELPTAVEAKGDTVWISEEQRSLELFRLTEAGPRPAGTISVPIQAYDLCVMGGRLYVEGWSPGDDRLVHELDAAGAELGSFGRFYDYRSDSRASIGVAFSEAEIACDADTDLVLVAPRVSFPEVRAYSADGQPRWRVLLEDYAVVPVEELEVGFRFSIPEDGYDKVHSLTVPVPGWALLQVAHVARGALDDGLEYESLDSYAIELRTGTPRYLGEDWPPVVAAQPGCYAVHPNEVIPAVEVYCRPR